MRVVRFELYVQPGNEDVGSDERDDTRIKCQLLNLLRWPTYIIDFGDN